MKTVETEIPDQDIKDAVENSKAPVVFLGLVLIIGIALTIFPEFFYLRDQFGNRMNTIFKFYFETWILWGIVASFASVELLSSLKNHKRMAFSLVWFVTILAGLAYPTVMLWQKTNGFKPSQWTLDGNAYIAQYDPDDYAAMQWLTQQPVAVIAESIGGSYSEYAQVSTRTGMPTVLGWLGHEGQWRGGYTEVGSRESDIKTLYSTTDWNSAKSIIQRYNIRYIYLGYLEKNLYQTDGKLLRENLPVVYENNGVAIFEVPVE